MTLIRNKQQLALHDLLVATRKTADHYRDAADFLGFIPASDELRRVASERERLIERLERAVRQAGDLPSLPDEDRESVEKFLHHVHANLSSDEVQDILRQRLDAEREFAHLLGSVEDAENVGGDDPRLLGDIEDHVHSVTARLERLLQEQS